MAAPAWAGAPVAPEPPTPVPSSAAASRDGARMTVRIAYLVPPGTEGVVPTAWRAFAGPRSERSLGAVGAGARMVPIVDGVYRFRASARMGSDPDRSGGFCVAPDFAAVGLAPVSATCMRGPRARRAALTARVPEATLFGDSVAATLDWVPGTRQAVARGLSVRFDLHACRRLVAAPCPPGAPSALESIRSLPGSLGDVVVVNVGYNDWAATYDVPRVVRALRARGVKRVVWMTLRETQASYRGINAQVHRAARRSAVLQVADWNRASRGSAWFAPDGVHLTRAGGWALAAFTRREIRTAIAHLRREAPR